MEAPEKLLGAAYPWLRVLSTTTEIDGYCQDASKPMEVHVLTENRHFDQRTFEALELLALLSEIDYDAWQSALYFTWIESARLLIDISVGRALRLSCAFDFNYEIEELDAHVDGFLERVTTGRHEGTDSAGYAELRSRLETAYRYREEGTKSYRAKPVPRDQLEIGVWIQMDESTFSYRLRKLVEILSTQRRTIKTSVTLSPEYKPLFRVRRTTPDYAENGVVTRQDLESMAEIVRCGGYLDRLGVYGIESDAGAAPQLANNLQIIVGSTSWVGSETERCEWGAVDAVQVSRLLDRRTVAAIFSALSLSGTVKRVFLNSKPYDDGTNPRTLSVEDRRHLW